MTAVGPEATQLPLGVVLTIDPQVVLWYALKDEAATEVHDATTVGPVTVLAQVVVV